MPCEGWLQVDYLFDKPMDRVLTASAENCRWTKANDNDIIGWRPAKSPEVAR
jgi:hypothetical protein